MNCLSCGNAFELKKKGSGGSNRSFCYECFPDGLDRKERNKLRATLLKQKAHDHKIETGCQNCSYNRYGGALEWHHTDNDKLYDPAVALNVSWNRYLVEASKCVLLCANCHREVHAGLISV